MGKRRRRILVVGQSTSILEGVADLLQLVGYHVDMSSDWADAEESSGALPPNLVIVDLSDASSETYTGSQQIRKDAQWSKVPFLFVSFSGDEQIRELQERGRNDNGRSHYYAHTLLSMDGLLETVQSCLN